MSGSLSVAHNTEWWRINFDELEIQKKIGSGGFGTEKSLLLLTEIGVVYKGVWRDQPVAIKMLHNDDMDKKEYEQFQREAALMVYVLLEISVMLQHNETTCQCRETIWSLPRSRSPNGYRDRIP